jgi:starvation-inducible DNA-binding protein
MKETSNLQSESKMYQTANELPQDARIELSILLNQKLANAIDLQLQLKQAHWNVKGPSFIGLHKLFDKIHESVGEYVDLIAERIVQLGAVAEGTIRLAAQKSQLEEYPTQLSDGMSHAAAISNCLSGFAHGIRLSINESEELNDPTTVDILTEILRGIEQWLWFVEAHCQARE